MAPPTGATPGASWQLTLTAAGMVAGVAIPVTAGSLVGAGAFALHHRHHRRARDRYSAEAVDRAAILIPPPQEGAAL